MIKGFIKKERTSVSDNGGNPDFCNIAANDEEIFRMFKRHPRYNIIAENCNYRTGKKYLKIIKKQTPELINYFNKFRENDIYGSPKTYNYKKYGRLSPTTIEYIKVLSDLKFQFGNLDGMNIIEIGGGYGGQCKIILDFFNIGSYTMVDLKPALNLAEKYLDKLDVKNVNFLTMDELENKEYDLIISNYAFSECAKFVQDSYLKKVVGNSQRGYIIWDFHIRDTNLDTYGVGEFVKKMKSLGANVNLKRIPLPLKNFVLFWNKNDNSFSRYRLVTLGRVNNALSSFPPHLYWGSINFLKKKLPKIYKLFLPVKKRLFPRDYKEL